MANRVAGRQGWMATLFLGDIHFIHLLSPQAVTYAIGVAWAAQDELDIIATHPARDHAFFVDEFDNLYKVVPKVIQNICTEFNSQPRN